MLPDQPSQTALRVALARAIEAQRPENRRICSDMYASYFLDKPMRQVHGSWFRRKLYTLMSDNRMPGVIGSVLARTRFIDDLLREKIKAGIDQLVILGAGYDTRMFRFQDRLNNVSVFEVDHPATQERKLAVIRSAIGATSSNVTFVPVRFNSEDFGQRLRAFGYRSSGRSFFIWEGVTYYISAQAVDHTLNFVTGHSAAGSTIVFDYFPPSVAAGTCRFKEAHAMRRRFAQFGENFYFGLAPGTIEEFLSAKGFDRIQNLTPADIRNRYSGPGFRKRRMSAVFHFASAVVMPKTLSIKAKNSRRVR